MLQQTTGALSFRLLCLYEIQCFVSYKHNKRQQFRCVVSSEGDGIRKIYLHFYDLFSHLNKKKQGQRPTVYIIFTSLPLVDRFCTFKGLRVNKQIWNRSQIRSEVLHWIISFYWFGVFVFCRSLNQEISDPRDFEFFYF